jgi:hypothetical protein
MHFRLLAAALSILTLSATVHAQIPQLINYQGRVVVGSTNFNGTGQFKFALVNDTGSQTYWSNDGTSVNGSEPANAVSLAVSNGLYSVLLGNATLPNMIVVPATVFTNPDVRLRVWFNDGTTGFQMLSPDQRIAAVGYAMLSSTVVDGAINTTKLADGAVTNAKLDPTLAADLARKSTSQTFSGPNTFSSTSNSFTGSGSGLTSLNAGNVSSGTLSDARLSTNIAVRGGGNTFTGSNVFSNLGNSFTGNGSGLTQLNASALSSGTVLDARLSINIPRLNAANDFVGEQTIMSGNLGVGTTSPGERLEVLGSDATVRIRNSNDAIGGFIGDTFGALQLGIYNPSASTVGVVPANTKRSFFGIDGTTGKVGSLTNNFLNPAFRVVLDDGTGTMDFPDTQYQKINLSSASYGLGTQTNAVYQRSPGSFQWFQGGTHNNAEGNPGTGGTRLMRLDTDGDLEFNNMPGLHYGQSNSGGFGVDEGVTQTVDEISIRVPAAGYVFITAFVEGFGNTSAEFTLYDVTGSPVTLARAFPNQFTNQASVSWVLEVGGSQYINLKTTMYVADDGNTATGYSWLFRDHNLTAIYLPVRYQ